MPDRCLEEIEVSPHVIAFISASGEDFRVSTTCLGPVLHPVRLKPPKETDLVLPVGERRLYVSRVQARHLRRIGDEMLTDDGRLACG